MAHGRLRIERLYRFARLLQQANLVDIFVLLDSVDILDHAFSSIVAGRHSKPHTSPLWPWPREEGYVLIIGRSISVDLHPTRALLGVRGANLVQAENLPRRVVKLVMVDLVRSKGGIEGDFYV